MAHINLLFAATALCFPSVLMVTQIRSATMDGFYLNHTSSWRQSSGSGEIQQVATLRYYRCMLFCQERYRFTITCCRRLCGTRQVKGTISLWHVDPLEVHLFKKTLVMLLSIRKLASSFPASPGDHNSQVASYRSKRSTGKEVGIEAKHSRQDDDHAGTVCVKSVWFYCIVTVAAVLLMLLVILVGCYWSEMWHDASRCCLGGRSGVMDDVHYSAPRLTGKKPLTTQSHLAFLDDRSSGTTPHSLLTNNDPWDPSAGLYSGQSTSPSNLQPMQLKYNTTTGTTSAALLVNQSRLFGATARPSLLQAASSRRHGEVDGNSPFDAFPAPRERSLPPDSLGGKSMFASLPQFLRKGDRRAQHLPETPFYLDADYDNTMSLEASDFLSMSNLHKPNPSASLTSRSSQRLRERYLSSLGPLHGVDNALLFDKPTSTLDVSAAESNYEIMFPQVQTTDGTANDHSPVYNHMPQDNDIVGHESQEQLRHHDDDYNTSAGAAGTFQSVIHFTADPNLAIAAGDADGSQVDTYNTAQDFYASDTELESIKPPSLDPSYYAIDDNSEAMFDDCLSSQAHVNSDDPPLAEATPVEVCTIANPAEKSICHQFNPSSHADRSGLPVKSTPEDDVATEVCTTVCGDVTAMPELAGDNAGDNDVFLRDGSSDLSLPFTEELAVHRLNSSSALEHFARNRSSLNWNSEEPLSSSCFAWMKSGEGSSYEEQDDVLLQRDILDNLNAWPQISQLHALDFNVDGPCTSSLYDTSEFEKIGDVGDDDWQTLASCTGPVTSWLKTDDIIIQEDGPEAFVIPSDPIAADNHDHETDVKVAHPTVGKVSKPGVTRQTDENSLQPSMKKAKAPRRPLTSNPLADLTNVRAN